MMEMNKIENLASEMLEDAAKALKNFKKGSRLREHYLKLTVMNNVFRAYVTAYELPPEYKEAQENFLKVLKAVEARPNRAVFLGERIILERAYEHYQILLDSSEPDEVHEMVSFVDSQREAGRWVVTGSKTMKGTLRKALKNNRLPI